MTKLLLFVEKFCVFIQKEDYHFCIWLFVKNFDVYSTKKRLSQNRVEMASFVSSPIEVIWIFLKKGVYKLTFEGFILSNFFFSLP